MSEELKPASVHDANVFLPGSLGPVRREVVLAYEHDRVVDHLRAELAAIKAGQGEAITEVAAETFSSDGTSDIITCNLPIGTKLYLSAPPASAAAVSVAPGLERAIQIVREVAKTQPGYSDEREAIFEALSEAYAEAKAPASADAVSVPAAMPERWEDRLSRMHQTIQAGCWPKRWVDDAKDYELGELRALLARQEVK